MGFWAGWGWEMGGLGFGAEVAAAGLWVGPASKRITPSGSVTGFAAGDAGGRGSRAGAEPGAEAAAPAEGFGGGSARGLGARLAGGGDWGGDEAGGDDGHGGGEAVGDAAQGVAGEFVGRGRHPVRKGAAADLRLDHQDQVLDQVQELLGCRFGHYDYIVHGRDHVNEKCRKC